MAITIVETPGASNANSYETVEEADDYFEGRLALNPEWDDADSKEALLVMATRTLDMMFVGRRTLKRDSCNCEVYVTGRKWTGSPASTTQRLAWPRLGMTDRNGNSLDFGISSISVDVAAVVTTDRPHGRVSGETVFIVNSDSTPSIDGARVVTVLSSTTFSVLVTVTVAGTTGTMTFIPQDLKDAESELAGQLGLGDRTLDNDVSVQGIRSISAGSVSISFKDVIEAKVIPDAVLNLMPMEWFTDELVEGAQEAQFDVIQ